MYIMGENPAMSEPRPEPRAPRAGVAQAPGGAGHLPDRNRLAGRCESCRRAWPEKTGTVSNTDRMVQMGRRAL